jgi:EAL domain-containing protein (putative c-di-GMP-specific phosphodiesterase class I)
VNISGRSLDDPTLPQYIGEELKRQGVNPKRLIIELTETAAVVEMQDAQRFIEALQQTGCLICLDDFGSGFSTFAYLKYLDIQILKIDGMFIRDLPNNRDNQAFVKAMIDVARGLEKVTVAEFVEDGATLEMLREFGVDMAQGYHLDRPAADHPSLANR